MNRGQNRKYSNKAEKEFEDKKQDKKQASPQKARANTSYRGGAGGERFNQRSYAC